MKKILLLAVLAGIVYFVGTNIFTSVQNSTQAAQAVGTLPTNYPKVKIYKDKVKSELNKGNLILSAYLETNAPEKMLLNVGIPQIQKDGVAFTATSSDFKAMGVRIVRRGFLGVGPEGKGTASSSFEIKKGKNLYLVQWAINSYNMPLGTYTMAFSGYTAGQSTTTVPLNSSWSKPITLTMSTERTLNGTEYRIQTYNNKAWGNATGTPRIAFSGGKMRAKFCDSVLEGVYEVNKGRLVASLKGSMGNCTTQDAKNVEKEFVQYIKYGMPVSIEGENLKLNLKSRGIDAEFTFVKTSSTSNVIAGGITRIYPCDFVGPLEVGAIRDCSGLGNVLGVGLPMLTSISTTSTRIGSSIIVGGTNFATSNLVMFTPISASLASPQVVVKVATSSVDTLTFTVPTTYLCADGTTSCSSLPAITPGTYRVQVKTPAGISPGSFSVVIY